MDEGKIIPFLGSDDERARKLKTEVERLSRQSAAEYLMYLHTPGYVEKFGVSVDAMKAMIEATIAEREKAAAIDRGEKREDRKFSLSVRRVESEEEARRKRERDKEDAKEAARKREIARELEKIARLPAVTHELRLSEMSKRLGVGVDDLREELRFFVVPEKQGRGGFLVEEVDMWNKEVDTRALIDELVQQLRLYIVVSNEGALAIALWVLFAWCHEIARHSPPLLVTSVDLQSGKSTLARVAAQFCPRPMKAGEPTLASIFRTIDRFNPTLLIDEADTMFMRSSPIAHLINESWERGAQVPRMSDTRDTVWFNIFGPKIIAMKGEDLPETTASRCIRIKLLPRLASEAIEEFKYADDDEFKTLRAKCLRWAADHIEALKVATPEMPPGMINRPAMNWRLQFAISDLAGSVMGRKARAAAVKLLADSLEVRMSRGQRVLLAMEPLLKARREMFTKDLLARLGEDPEWARLNEHQLGHLLKPYGIKATRMTVGRERLRGYRYADCKEVFERHIPREARKK